ncbi:MAG: fused MFS/spermidine synthase, partial [Rhodobacterales bacterium]|nr:fused MFS/spermidine synthase [Rhodobacterales bacterium]
RIGLALGGAAVTTLATLPLLRALAGLLLGGALGAIPAIVVLATALFLLPSLCVGVVSPILTKLAMDDRPGETGPVLGRMFALGTLGSIFGTLGAGYLFLSWIGSAGTILAVAATYAVLAVAFLVTHRRAGLGALLVLAAAGGAVGLWGRSVTAFASPCQVESDYFCIRVDDMSAQTGRPSALMALDHLVHSINDRDDPDLFYSPYIHFVDELARRRLAEGEPPRAFFIGGGGFTLPRAWAARYPGADLTVAELDPAVTRAAADHLWLDPAAPGLTILHRDARAALQAIPPGPVFDLVFGDAFHDIAIPPHLVTREFHARIARRLKPTGVYAVNVVDRGQDPRFLMALVRTLDLDFPHVEVWIEGDPGTAGGLALRGRTTFVIVAGQQPSPGNRLRAGSGFDRLWVRWPGPNLRRRVAQAGGPVLTDDLAPVDRLMSGLLLAEDGR